MIPLTFDSVGAFLRLVLSLRNSDNQVFKKTHPASSGSIIQVFSKYMATAFKIYGPHFPKSRTTPTTCGSDDDDIGDDDKDITTGGTTWSLGVLSGAHAGNDATWMATQVGLRGVKAGLGCHDDGVSGDDAGVENASIPLWKRGRLALSESPTFSDFVPARKDIFSRDKTVLVKHVDWKPLASLQQGLSSSRRYFNEIN